LCNRRGIATVICDTPCTCYLYRAAATLAVLVGNTGYVTVICSCGAGKSQILCQGDTCLCLVIGKVCYVTYITAFKGIAIWRCNSWCRGIIYIDSLRNRCGIATVIGNTPCTGYLYRAAAALAVLVGNTGYVAVITGCGALKSKIPRKGDGSLCLIVGKGCYVAYITTLKRIVIRCRYCWCRGIVYIDSLGDCCGIATVIGNAPCACYLYRAAATLAVLVGYTGYVAVICGGCTCQR